MKVPVKASQQGSTFLKGDLGNCIYVLDQIDSLNIIHVAGSKGKGSTCAYIESILRKEGYRTGLFTSPHLINVEERIRINGLPVDRDVFAKAFWNLYEKFEENKNMYHPMYPKPTFLSLILHLALRLFLSEKVDVAILEVGLGGKYDHTNFIRCPLVTAVNTIELEHTDLLGDTIEEIAESKAGIFKPNVPAVVGWNQPSRVMDVFIARANSVKCPLYIAPSFDVIESEARGQKNWELLKQTVMDVPIRGKNISLALSIVSLWHSAKDRLSGGVECSHKSISAKTLSVVPTEIQIEGALSAQVVGRFQEVNVSENVHFFIDCAHTIESMECCSKWFLACNESSKPNEQPPYKILLFTVTGSRNPLEMLSILEKHHFDVIYFVDYVSGSLKRLPGKKPQLSVCVTQWQKLNSSTPCYELANENFPQFISQLQNWDGESTLHLPFEDVSTRRINVLTVGSFYLAGDVLKLLKQPLRWI
nr:hypothetical transcript [Hymenolepis microstoma]